MEERGKTVRGGEEFSNLQEETMIWQKGFDKQKRGACETDSSEGLPENKMKNRPRKEKRKKSTSSAGWAGE